MFRMLLLLVHYLVGFLNILFNYNIHLQVTFCIGAHLTSVSQKAFHFYFIQ